MNAQPVWAAHPRPTFPTLTADVHADALVIGGGIAGVTAAYLLAKAGKSVVLLEKEHLGGGETGHTTAHISYPTDKRLTELVHSFGLDHAQAIWDACQASSQQIADNVAAEAIDCELRRVPSYLYACGEDVEAEAKKLREEAALAQRLGFDAHYTSSCPVTRQPAIVFANLLKFHPTKYLSALAQSAVKAGARIFEKSEAGEFDKDASQVTCNGHKVTYQHVFIATHVPLQGGANTLNAALLQTKLAGYSTYALGARLPSGSAPEALWWDTADPYFYLRIDRSDDDLYAIAGGEDHKTGQEGNTEAHYTSLTAKLHSLFPEAVPDHRWSGQVIETVDGLPYIGEYAGQFVATGFSGTGMTFGTLSAMMFADRVKGIANPWRDLFHVDRKHLSGAWDYLKENKDYPWYLLKRPFIGASNDPSQVLTGEGKILRHDHQKVAAYRDEDGKLTLLSAICPHMGCVVNWNAADKSWDCPCHGSRFTAKGKVIAGPAESPLKPVG
ncbi:MAG TPA: FAD-dependent oxidoreductase [Prosthecobacter sp.]|nr:FAD-dependent oxidoreductase [Prosthecobacter sp.]